MILSRRDSTLDGKSQARAVEINPTFPSIHRVIKSPWFEAWNTVLYFLNIFLFIARTYNTAEVNAPLFAGEALMIGFQCIELSFRFLGSLGVVKRNWFSNIINVFDTFVVIGFLGVVGSVILPLLGNQMLVKLRRLQIVRVYRLKEVVKSFRTKPIFKPLHIIMNGISTSYATIAFTFAIVTLVLYSFAVLYLIILQDSPNANAQRYFGSISKAFYTMFQIMTTESWNEMMRPIYLDHPSVVVLTTMFIGVTKYLILSLVTALILESAMATVSGDEETLASKRRAERERISKELTFLFQAQLGNQTTVITKDEFEWLTDEPSVKSRLQQLGWFKTELIDLWELLDTEGGCVLELEPIVFSVHKLRGKARTKDLLLGLKEASRALRVMDEFVDRLSSSVNAIGRAQESLVRVQGGAKKIVQSVEKLKIAIAARERVQGRFQGISEIHRSN